MAHDGRVYGTPYWTGPAIVGTDGEDAIEAILTNSPWIPVGDSAVDDTAASRWIEYVDRTGIIPPDGVIDLLSQGVQEAIRQAARAGKRF